MEGSEPEIKIVHGDCRDVMAAMEPGLVGAVVCDPPYGIEHASNHGASWQGKTIHNDHDSEVRDWVVGWAESRGLPWAVFGSWKQPRPAKVRGVLVWDKGPAFGMGDLSFPWKASWEEIYIGGPGWKGKRDEGVLRGHFVPPTETNGRRHPHQKPVSLILHLLKKLPDLHGLPVLDPCAGSGSTLVACQKAGLNAIGIESDPQWLPLIERRVADARTPLFGALS